MKIDITYDLGEVVIETDTNHGNVEAVFIDGLDVSDLTAVEMIIKVIGEEKWQQLISKTIDDAINI